jgi:nitrous oxidase accessory protein NosD
VKRYLALPLVVALAILAFGPAASASATFYVNDNNCPGPGTGSRANPFCTISEAVAAASSGDTIIVRPGTYTETVLVDKSLQIRGAQAGKAATKRRTAASKESTLNDADGGFNLQADNISINGFTIEGAFDTSMTSLASGIKTSPTHSGYRIIDNIIRDNIAGIYLQSDGTFPSTVARNRIQANNEAGSGSGNGIESDGGLHNVGIRNNVFSGNFNGALLLADSLPATNSNVQFVKNRADSPVLLYNTATSSVSRNTFVKDVGSAVFLGGNDQTISIIENNMFSPVFAGVRLADSPTTINTGITINKNKVTGAGFYGIHIGVDSLTGGTINGNVVRGSDPVGLFVETGNTNNFFGHNTVTQSKQTDIEDDTSGTGTAGTANTYVHDRCGSSIPDGLCT